MTNKKYAAVTAAVLAAMGGDLEELKEHARSPWDDERVREWVLVPAPVREVFEKLGVRVHYARDGRGAFYDDDAGDGFDIHLPPPSAFTTPEAFARVAFHELTHWTQHPQRLQRGKPFTGWDSRASYDAEELVAELGSAYLMAHYGLTDDVQAHAGYLLGYTRELEGDRFVFNQAYIGPLGECNRCEGKPPMDWAVGKAREATDWILSRVA